MSEWKPYKDYPHATEPNGYTLALGEGLMQISVYREQYGQWAVNVGSVQCGRLADLEVAKTVGISVARGLLEKALRELTQ